MDDIRCGSCGGDNPGSHRFCSGCGTALAAVHCASCGAAVADDAKFCSACGALLVAERRQLTIMFVDLVGSTALSSRLDPEDLRDVIGAYQRTVTAIVDRLHGHIAQYLGDGMLVYFGYPRALERTADSAVRAALESVEAVRTLSTPHAVSLAIRIGIATGLVVVGDVGSGATAEKLAVGETPNLAARIQSMAPENGVLIADSSRRMLGDRFELEDAGQHALKGFDAPVQVWRVRAERGVARRFENVRGGRHAPLVGRAAELGTILSAWRETRAGRGRIALVTGDPGMGKSRLLLAAIDDAELRDAAVVCLQCSPYHAQSAFFPLLSWLRGEIDHAASPHARLAELVERAGLGADAVVRLGALLSVDVGGAPAAAPGTAARERRETLLGFLALLVSAADGAPLLLAIEDLQWADPSTLDVLELVAGRIATMPVMLLATARPEFTAEWMDRASIARLEALRPDEAAEIVASIAGVAVSRQLVERIVSHTDGVPLFLEELTKSVIESAVDAAGRGSRPDVRLPHTLRDSLTTRLDRLADGKAVAQVAALLGRQFSGRVLRAVWRASQHKLREGVEQLVSAGMLFGPPWPSDGQYTFKHALVQDAASESLLRKEWREQHAHIATVLESVLPDVLANEPEVVAGHYAAGHRWTDAVRCWLLAGRHALAQNAHTEAIVHLEAALEALRDVPAGTEHDVMESDVELVLLPALIAARGYGHPRVFEVGERCAALCERIGDPLRRFTAIFPVCTCEMVRANHAESQRLATELAAIAAEVGDDSLRIETNLLLGLCRFFGGDFAEADRHLGECLAEYDVARHGDHTQRFGQDPAIVALCYRSWLRWIRGEHEAAAEASAEAVARARATGHPLSLAFALTFAAWRCAYGHDADGARAWIEELLAVGDREAIPVFHAHGRVLAAWFACCEARHAEAVPALRDAVRAFEATGSRCYLSLWLAFLAVAEGEAGDWDTADATIERALAELERSGEQWARPEVLRLAARVADARGTPDVAHERLDRAIRCAVEYGSRSWEVRAGRDLAESLWRRGRHADARARLDDVIDRVAADARDRDAESAIRLRGTFRQS